MKIIDAGCCVTDRRETVIGADCPGWSYVEQLWEYREVFCFLAWRDLLVRYKEAEFGILWALFRPMIMTAIFVLVFGKIAGLPSDNQPYALYVLAALIPWQFFSSSVAESSECLLKDRNLLLRIYFPRVIPVLSVLCTALVECLIFGLAVSVLFIWVGILPTWKVVFIPGLLLMTFFLGLGGAFFACALNTRFRDFRFVVPFLLQACLYISPVGFSADLIPAAWAPIYALNPMVGIIGGFRWAMFEGVSPFPVSALVEAAVVIAVLNWAGVKTFRRMESRLADII